MPRFRLLRLQIASCCLYWPAPECLPGTHGIRRMPPMVLHAIALGMQDYAMDRRFLLSTCSMLGVDTSQAGASRLQHSFSR